MEGFVTGEHEIAFLQAQYTDIIQRTLTDGVINGIVQHLSMRTDEFLHLFRFQQFGTEFRLLVQPCHQEDEAGFNTGCVYICIFFTG